MPKHFRLTISDLKHFRPVQRVAGSYFSLAIGPYVGIRAACVVSKKASAHAVDRNKIRRRARAILAPLLPKLPEGAYVFYAKREALDADFTEIKNDLTKLLGRVS